MGDIIEFAANGGTAQGYLAMPELPGPGVIVLQEWWGLVDHIKSVADRFAAEGFVAFAPDLYDGDSTTEPDEAASLFQALNIDHTAKQLAGAVKLLQAHPSVQGKVGVVGFCMGGQLSMYAAATNPEIAACVNFYGVHPNVHPPYENLKAPMLGLFAELDESTSPAVVAGLDERLTQLGKTHNFISYPQVHHAFFNDDRPSVYNADAAEDAWKRTLAFFRANLL